MQRNSYKQRANHPTQQYSLWGYLSRETPNLVTQTNVNGIGIGIGANRIGA